jgi:SAM-dependent methyltransferase/predicted kinase
MLIAMKGPPGAGKSTISRALSRSLGWPLIDKDDVKDVLDGQTPLAGVLAYEIMIQIVRRQVAQGLSVICDSPLLARTYDGLRRVADEASVQLVVVACHCGDEAVWRERVEARQAQGLPEHHTVTWERVQTFLAQPGVDYPTAVPHLVVDTARPLAPLVDEIVGWLCEQGVDRALTAPAGNEGATIMVDGDRAALAWQTGVWDRMAEVYPREIDHRFAPVVAGVLARAALRDGERVLDLGTGTGAVAEGAAGTVGPNGEIIGLDISPAMLALATARADALGLGNVRYVEGRAEAIPAPDASFDVVLASLSLMFVVDREAAAREIARVLRPGGRFVAAVWAGPERCDIVRFQQIAGAFAPTPPVPGVGPGALADPRPFLAQLAQTGIAARVETKTLGFDFAGFAAAWEALAQVTTAELAPERQREAQAAVLVALYPGGDGPRHFRNETQFLVGIRRGFGPDTEET